MLQTTRPYGVCFLVALTIAAGLTARARAAGQPAWPAHSGFTVTPPTSAQPYLMAFHVCVTGAPDCNNPSYHRVWLAVSADSVTWETLAGWQAYEGSVPDVVRRGNTLYLAATGTSGLSKIDLTTGAVTSHQMRVTRANGSDALPRDISFAGQLSDGRFVIVYVPPMQEVDPNSNERAVFIATEVAGTDATSFAYTGTVITIDKRTLPVAGDPTDPDIHWNGQRWVLYLSVGSSVVAYTSDSLTGPYSPATQTLVSNLAGGVPSATLSADGSQLLLFVNSGTTRSNLSIRRAAASPTPAAVSSSAFSTILSGTAYGGTSAESPGVALNTAGIPCPSCTIATSAPGAPTNLTVNASGTTVTLQWRAPTTGGAVTAYVLEAGSSSGASNLYNAAVGTATSMTTQAPLGSYYVRVKARNASGTSAASNEVNFSVGGVSPPGTPGGLTATAAGNLVTARWSAPASGGTVSEYVLEAGTRSGGIDVYNGSVGAGTTLSAHAAAGTYFLRVRARNSAGTSAASNEASVIVGGGCTRPPAPTGVSGSVVSGVARVQWIASPGATSYVVRAGSTSGASNIFNGNIGSLLAVSSPVAAGFSAYVRVYAVTACGESDASPELALR